LYSSGFVTLAGPIALFIGEIFHQTADNVAKADQTGFTIGGYYDFDEHNHLLFSAGTGIQNASTTNVFSWYLGWQITY